MWTNRLKEIILPKILPLSQFNYKQEVNIIDELWEVRSFNVDLLSKGSQKDGTILSKELQNAFWSVSLSSFHLVLN